MNNLQQAIKAAAGQKHVPVASLTNDLSVASVMSKLVADPVSAARSKHMARQGPDQLMMQEVSNDTATKINDARNFLQLLPDVKMGIEILISSVLAPKDMIETSVTYTSQTELLPPDVLATLNGLVEEYFRKDYKITPLLPKILREILSETGSYAIAVLPENTVDDLINGQDFNIGFESYQDLEKQGLFDPIGILGPATKVTQSTGFSFESYTAVRKPNPEQWVIRDTKKEGLFISVNDNPNILKRAALVNTLASRKRDELLGMGTALEQHVGRLDIPIYKDRPHHSKPMAVARTHEQLQRRSAGQSLKLKVPSEAMIPVFTPGDPSNHLGYYVLLDATGNFISVDRNQDYYAQLRDAYRSNENANSSMVQRISAQYNAFDYTARHQVDNIVASYAALIEDDLMRRLKNGIAGQEVRIANIEQIWQIMLTRTFRQQHTQVLYLPRELLTYMAIDYNENGIGRSLIEDMRILLGMRVVLMFANTMASVRNSISRTRVNVKLDEHDVDPWKTIEIIMGEINRSRSSFGGVFPIGNSAPVDVVDYLARAGYEFTYEGHPAMPDVAVDFDEKTSNHARVDTDLEDHLAKRTVMSMSVPPETVDNAFSPEFARTVTANHIMLSKRSIQIQDIWTPQLSEHCQNVLRNDGVVVDSMVKVIEENLDTIIKRLVNKEEYPALTKETKIDDEVRRKVKGAVLRDYIQSFEVQLSRPNSVQLENQLEEFEIYMKGVEEGLKYIFDSAFANSDTMGELGEQTDLLMETAKAMFAREWMAKNNLMPELFDLVTEDENGKINRDLYEDSANHVHKLTKAVARFLVSIRENIEASNTFAEANQIEEPENSGGSDTTEDTNTDGEGGGNDDFSFDMDETEETEGEPDAETETETEGEGTESESEGEAAADTNTETEE